MSETTNNPIPNLLRRAVIFLEDGEWEKADEYAEKVLDVEPENSDAYLYKLLCENHIARKELLGGAPVDLSQNKNYQNALKFADAAQKTFLEDCARNALLALMDKEEAQDVQKRIDSHQETIKTFSDIIDTFRDLQYSNRAMIKRGKSAVAMYFISFAVYIILIAALVIRMTVGIRGIGLVVFVQLGFAACHIILVIAHARLVRFWDIDYKNDRGWLMPVFFGLINVIFTLSIWGFVKSFKTIAEYKGLAANNAKMDQQIEEYKKNIEKRKAEIKELQAAAAQSSPRAQAATFCPECGAKIADGGKFCGDCGYRL